LKTAKPIYILLLLLLSSCSALKLVPPTEKLYTGSKIEIVSGEKTAFLKAKGEAADIISPKPNSDFFKSRPELWVYYKTQKDTSGLKKWIHKKIGKAPVYASQTDPEMLCKAIDARLFNLGYFNSLTTYVAKIDSHTTSYIFKVELGNAYTIGAIDYPPSNDSLSGLISNQKQNSLLIIGKKYNLDVLKQERDRLDEILKNKGYFYFNNEYLLFKADTTFGYNQVKIKLTLKADCPAEAKTTYTVKDVNIFAEYQLGKENKSEVQIIDSTNFYSPTNYIRPAPILHAVFLRNNKTYSRSDHNLTLSRLNGLGVYKFVSVRLIKNDSLDNFLNAIILLTPRDKKSLSLEVQGTSKSNNFIGPGIKGGFKNRNTFGGAELLVINAGASFETQFNGPYKGQYTYEFNPKIELYVPRFIVPFHLADRSLYVPKTKFVVDLSYMSRVNYYDINSAKFSFGYRWKNSLPTDHDLSLLNINYFNVYNQSADFDSLINENPTMALRFEKQFIAGIGYSFTYNQQLYDQKRNPIYINPSIELAGSTLSGINKLMGKTPDASNPLQVFGVNYAQFVKFDLDVRQLFKLNRQGASVIATRLFAGWGLPFGNASTIPYIKQYFSGGAYSLRGFPVYSVGPGTFSPPDSVADLYFVQQGGEIKLELNIEYRFTIAGMLKGAIFTDAGNTWLNNDNPEIPGGKFNPQTFIKELAIDIGTGIRYDVKFFVIRLDLGMPIRKPWYPEGNRFVFNEFDISSSKWRKDNLILNLAFGYPF
jgi:outer membrane protein insertion porin family